MSDRGESIIEGLADAIAYAKGDESRGRRHRFAKVDVKAVREKLSMSQDQFSKTFGISAGTLRGWEQGRRVPEGPARVLLQVIDREPEAVKRALAG